MSLSCNELCPGSSRRCQLPEGHDQEEHRSELSQFSYVHWYGAAYPVLHRAKHDGWREGTNPWGAL